jgi:hypothetical protein
MTPGGSREAGEDLLAPSRDAVFWRRGCAGLSGSSVQALDFGLQ